MNADAAVRRYTGPGEEDQAVLLTADTAVADARLSTALINSGHTLGTYP